MADRDIAFMQSSQTLRKYSPWSNQHDYNLEIFRPETNEFYTTQIDELHPRLLGQFKGRYHYADLQISLRKNNAFETIPELLEELSINTTTTINKKENSKIIEYQVPVTSMLLTEQQKQSIQSKLYYNEYMYENHEIDDNEHQTKRIKQHPYYREHYISINGKTLSNQKTYKRIGQNFVEVEIPQNYVSFTAASLKDNEKYCIGDMNIRANTIYIRFKKEEKIYCLQVCPERLQFEYLHSDIIHCKNYCTKAKHTTCILKNEPGYLQKFDLYYRSSLSDGQWIKHGTFTGNHSIFEYNKVYFDEIQVKEIRVIPTSYHKSYNKIYIFPIGKTNIKKPSVSNHVVKYTIEYPLNNQYMKTGSYVPQNYHYGKHQFIRNDKKTMRNHQRFIRDACNDTVLDGCDDYSIDLTNEYDE